LVKLIDRSFAATRP